MGTSADIAAFVVVAGPCSTRTPARSNEDPAHRMRAVDRADGRCHRVIDAAAGPRPGRESLGA